MGTSGITQKRKGALADGSAPKKVHAAVEEMNDDLGQAAYNALRQRLSQVLVNPTGYYESRVTTDVSSDSVEISDGGVIYGPWLEGTSSRNGRSRFKGYATFRKVTQDIESKAKQLAETSLSQKLRSIQ